MFTLSAQLLRMAVNRTLVALAFGLIAGCTGQIPNAFRLSQQEEYFSTQQQINTRLDMLWVIDNSGSMNVSQDRLRQGFTTFANRYMQPTWDIRVAVITTDTYIAHSAFNNYRNTYTLNPGNTYTSNYLRGITSGGIPGRTTPFVNPSWNPTLIDTNPASPTYGRAPGGVRVRDERPEYTTNYAKLLPGLHDGPMQAFCWERMGSFISPSGLIRCFIRDDQTAYNGPSHCLAPTGTETVESQCVNTLMNNTVRSGKSIISTIPPVGTPPDAAWTNQLISDFLVNLSPGFWGHGSERGLASIQQLIQDNEGTGSSTKFFRPDALRVIVLVGDEDDQTMVYPSSPSGSFSPSTDYIGSCTKDIDGNTVTIANCPDPTKLISVPTIKSQLDTFFQALDGSGATGDPGYFVASIVASTYASVMSIRAQRGTNEIDRADRFIALGNLVGNGSLVVDIDSPDYSPLLDAIGQAIIQKKAVFTLSRAPSGLEELAVYIVHANGSRTQIPATAYTVSGQALTITDLNIVLSFQSTDRILISYQPKLV